MKCLSKDHMAIVVTRLRERVSPRIDDMYVRGYVRGSMGYSKKMEKVPKTYTQLMSLTYPDLLKEFIAAVKTM